MKAERSIDGFSMLEMLVTLTMLSILGGLLFATLPASKHHETLNRLSQKVGHMAQETSIRAVTRGETTRIIVDAAKRRIDGSQGQQEVAVPSDFKLVILTGSELVEQGSIGAIEFYEDGTSSGGEIKFEDPSGSSSSVRIDWLTGAVTIRRRTPS